jgi:hypothetical protein
MLRKKPLVISVGVFLGALLALQFVPVHADVVHLANSGSGVHAATMEAFEQSLQLTPEVRAIVSRSCVNCHSHETQWPWYARIAPVSWLVRKDVAQARGAMNFSAWASGPGKRPSYQASMLLAACQSASTGRMPPAEYVLLHPESKLQAGDVEVLCGWAKSEARRLIVSSRKPAAPEPPAGGAETP